MMIMGRTLMVSVLFMALKTNNFYAQTAMAAQRSDEITLLLPPSTSSLSSFTVRIGHTTQRRTRAPIRVLPVVPGMVATLIRRLVRLEHLRLLVSRRLKSNNKRAITLSMIPSTISRKRHRRFTSLRMSIRLSRRMRRIIRLGRIRNTRISTLQHLPAIVNRFSNHPLSFRLFSHSQTLLNAAITSFYPGFLSSAQHTHTLSLHKMVPTTPRLFRQALRLQRQDAQTLLQACSGSSFGGTLPSSCINSTLSRYRDAKSAFRSGGASFTLEDHYSYNSLCFSLQCHHHGLAILHLELIWFHGDLCQAR